MAEVSKSATVTFAGRRASVESLSVPSAKDQDRLGVGADCIVVADGVTPLDPAEGPRVQAFAQAAVDVVLGAGGAPLPDVLRAAADHNPGDGEIPACAFGSARAVDGQIELGSVADVGVFVRFRDGREIDCTDPTLEGAEDRVARRFYRRLLDGETPAEARLSMRSGTSASRRIRNAEGSYWVVAEDPAVAEHAVITTVAPGDVEAILICSDGYARAWEMLGILPSPHAVLAGEVGLAQVASKIRLAEQWRENSPWPLFAADDDIAAVLLRMPD